MPTKVNENKVIKENNAVEENIPAPEKRVTVILPIDRNEVDDGVPVCVNNRRYVIKRGVPVKVPESVALILKSQEEMLQIAQDYEKSNMTHDQ